MIAPHFADLSEVLTLSHSFAVDNHQKYTQLKFLKIDVDRLRKTSQSLKIRAMPTFKVFSTIDRLLVLSLIIL